MSHNTPVKITTAEKKTAFEVARASQKMRVLRALLAASAGTWGGATIVMWVLDAQSWPADSAFAKLDPTILGLITWAFMLPMGIHLFRALLGKKPLRKDFR